MSISSAVAQISMDRMKAQVRSIAEHRGFGLVARVAFPLPSDSPGIPGGTHADDAKYIHLGRDIMRKLNTISREEIFAAFDAQRGEKLHGYRHVFFGAIPPRPEEAWEDIRAIWDRAYENDLTMANAEADQEEYIRRK